MMRRYKAALLGYYGFGNLGDELLLESSIGILNRNGISQDNIVVLSNDPKETSHNFHVDSINRWNVRESANAFRKSDMLVLGGGGLFQDSTSMKSCIWYWSMVRLAKFLGCKITAIGQSFGPLRSRLSLWLTLNALNSFSKIHVRDDPSYNIATKSKCRNIILGHDIVMNLKPQNMQIKRRNEYIIVNLRNHFMVDKYIRIIESHITKNIKGAALSDEDIEPLSRIMNRENIVRVRTFNEAQELWNGASCAIGMRLHFGVLSRIFKVPLALMPYDMKVSEFARQSGVPCITDAYVEPVMPLDIPDDICGEINSL